jgi:hypothetical protein
MSNNRLTRKEESQEKAKRESGGNINKDNAITKAQTDGDCYSFHTANER